MSILITGASGFIGQRLLSSLKNKNLILVSSKNRKGYIKINLKNPNFKKLDKLKIDTCIHLAWSSITDYSKKNSINNYKNSINLFKYLNKKNCKHIISLGSCWEYTENFGKKFENKIEKPNNIFGKYKNKISKYGLSSAKKNKTTFTWLRAFYVYGEEKKGLLSELNKSFKKNKKLFLKNPFKYNDFIFVDDVVKCILHAIKFKKNGIFNLGTGNKITTLSFCRTFCMIKNINENKIIEYKKSIFPNHGIWASIEKTKKYLNFRADTVLNKGISKSLKRLNYKKINI